MADDLVRELRRIAHVGREGSVGYWSGDHVIDPESDWATVERAADEIERLRRRLGETAEMYVEQSRVLRDALDVDAMERLRADSQRLQRVQEAVIQERDGRRDGPPATRQVPDLALRLEELTADIAHCKRAASDLDLFVLRQRIEAAGHLITDGRRVLDAEIEGGETDG